MSFNIFTSHRAVLFSSALFFMCFIVPVSHATVQDYLPLDYDGYQAKLYMYTTIRENGRIDSTEEGLLYYWVNGSEVIANTNCLKIYTSQIGFFKGIKDISYQGVEGNLYALYKHELLGSQGTTVQESSFTPYWITMKLDMDVGDSYTYRFTSNMKTDYGNFSSTMEATIEVLANESIQTYYGNYPDTLKVRASHTVISNDGFGTTQTNHTHWIARGIGQVRTVSDAGYGWTETTDFFTALSAQPDLDTDGDTIKDKDDNCPTVPNTNQADSDGDNVGDVCDGCPDDPTKTTPGACGCGQTDIDSDMDGVPDCNDSYPVVYGNINGDRKVDMMDLFLSLKLFTTQNMTNSLIESALKKNGKIKLEIAPYILQHAVEAR